jgi:hypothetical protein
VRLILQQQLHRRPCRRAQRQREAPPAVDHRLATGRQRDDLVCTADKTAIQYTAKSDAYRVHMVNRNILRSS